MEDTVVFLARNKFISVNFSIAFKEQSMRIAQNSFPEKPQFKKNRIKANLCIDWEGVPRSPPHT